MIVKIERLLSSNVQSPLALVYNKDRSFVVEVDLEFVAPLFKEGEVEVYCYVEMRGDQMVFLDEAPDQPW